ncbi:hypothetical protein AKJ48_03065 [candidate division MSBL1 archaeon SCGC-AAA261O19]|uniref:DNA-directed RNA polymerase subunit Rpo3 n=1 Tax=candidate division MSBL1 archaeon SCGC-AAA261O19 TaxID=1698277 RepID=A0A133VD19_9EURY|nr:hypothetical protein AKJ48_03065 [candidate division MSBL1 archaeon SCGC-AAA261O19]
MGIEIRELEGDTMRILITDTNPAFANSIRRAILQEIPVMAVDEVDVAANDSVMNDEILVHRLGQVPLHTPDGYRLPRECDCTDGRCPKCSVTLTLEKEGPGIIKTGDLESSDEEVVPVSDSIPLTRLDEGQNLEFTAIARLGFGKDHANWQPAVVAYKFMPIFELDEDACTACGDCIDACPKNILEIEDDEVKITNIEKCTMCLACIDSCPEDAINIDHDPTKVILKIESTGAMPPDQLLEKATEVLEDKCKEFAKKTKKL